MTSSRQVARITVVASAVVTAFVLALYLLWLLRTIVLLTALAAFVALALGPAVDRLTRHLHLPRWLAIVTVYLLIAASIFAIGLLFVPAVGQGVTSLAHDAPRYLQDLRRNPTFRHYDNRYHITVTVEHQITKLPSQLGSAAGTLRDVTVGVFSAAVELITVLTIAFFFLLDGGRTVRRAIDLLLPERHAERWRTLSGHVYRSVSGYVAGNFLISVIAGLVSYITLLILGVPFAAPLAVLMAFFDAIPLVGATIGAIIVGFVTLFNGFPTTTIIWIVVQVVYQQVESSILVPIVYRRTVRVSGLVTVIAVLIGAKLIGVLGALVAIPTAAALDIFVRELWSLRSPATPAAEPEPEPG
ncbi:MAG TPA: AI-2E family transporter [Solirubrobacteraceae bacterium]|nr:AI-2E family transporter [Solirubrobacteraceae bacterium]